MTEYFRGFVELKRTDVGTISSRLSVNLRNWCFDLTKLTERDYDGCSAMSGKVSGVKTRIVE